MSAFLLALAIEPACAKKISLTAIGRYATGLYDESAAEIAAYDAASARLFVVNGAEETIDILDLSDPTNPTRVGAIDVTTLGASANSVDVHDGVVAVAIQGSPAQDPGVAGFYDTDGNLLGSVQVGALPDMIVFTPDGQRVLVANEGEPNSSYTVDPEGSVSIIDVTGDLGALSASQVLTADFHAFDGVPLDPSVRVFGPGASASRDFEPEYIAVDPRSQRAWVTLQENNAIAIVDIRAGVVTDVVGLGYKDHGLEGNGLDASDRDNQVNIASWPVQGMYQPDAIGALLVGGDTWLVTANEGDARDYNTFSEQTRVGNVVLDPVAFPDAVTLQDDANLGRMRITNTQGDTDNDGDYDELYAFGARSFSVWDVHGQLIFDSGDAFEQITAQALPADFNSTNEANNSFDSRSDDKGPEPEGLAVGEVSGVPYVFIGLENIGGVVVYNLTDPAVPWFIQYVNERDFAGDAAAGTAGDLGPEGLHFISAADSPNGAPLLVVSNEISGTVTIFEIREP